MLYSVPGGKKAAPETLPASPQPQAPAQPGMGGEHTPCLVQGRHAEPQQGFSG